MPRCPEMTPAELRVMKALWELGRGSVADVRGELADRGNELAYTTVMTTLSRLHAKDAVTRRRTGRAYAYAPADTATSAARRMRRLLDGREDRSAVLARFLDELGPDDVPVLQRLLAQAEEPTSHDGS